MHWASDDSGQIQSWYRLAGAASWRAASTISGIPTVEWDNATGCCEPNADDQLEAYTAALSAPLSIWLDDVVDGTSLAAVEAALPERLVVLVGTLGVKRRGPGADWHGRRERASLVGLPRPRTQPGGSQGPPLRVQRSLKGHYAGGRHGGRQPVSRSSRSASGAKCARSRSSARSSSSAPAAGAFARRFQRSSR